MRLLKGQNTNSRNIYGRGLQVDTLDQLIADSTNSMRIPYGTTGQRPTTPANGQIRYNSTLNKVEAYENSAWRTVRYAEPIPSGITQQTLGNGDGSAVVFGPMASGDTNYPAPAAAQNVLVLVENVFQLATTNYTLAQNPAAAVGSGGTVTAGSFSIGLQYKIITAGDTNFTLIGAANSSVDTVFTATGVGTGTGTARQTGYYLVFTSAPDAGKPVTALHNFDK
tara:strand:- start:5205 stop:5876 length:672 start_codon:yes stop_codon:yes gene_type:complete